MLLIVSDQCSVRDRNCNDRTAVPNMIRSPTQRSSSNSKDSGSDTHAAGKKGQKEVQTEDRLTTRPTTRSKSKDSGSHTQGREDDNEEKEAQTSLAPRGSSNQSAEGADLFNVLERKTEQMAKYIRGMRQSNNKWELVRMTEEISLILNNLKSQIAGKPEEGERNEHNAEEIWKQIEKIVEDENGSIEPILGLVWPESMYEKVKVVHGNPLNAENKDNVALMFSKEEKNNAGIMGIAMRTCGQIDEIMENGSPKNGYQTIIQKMGNETKTRFLITEGESVGIKKMIEEIKNQKMKTLNMAAAGAIDTDRLRKLTEISFRDSDIRITLYKPENNKPGNAGTIIRKEKERDFDTIKINQINSGMSYAEMAGKWQEIKQKISPETLGVEIKGIRKNNKEEMFIRTQKGGAEILMQELQKEKQNILNAQIAQPITDKKPMLITRIEAGANEEDLRRGLNAALGTDLEIEIKKLYETRFGDQNAEIWIEENYMETLEKIQKIKVGWSVCIIKKKVRVDRCTLCLKLGHPRFKCRAKEQEEKKCFNCTKPGHTIKECQEQAFCNECNRAGHTPVTTECPMFRKRLNNNRHI